MSIELRKFPYPYQAALTICSDIDGTSLENFIEIHKFLNTNQNTSLGPGLNLPIGDSFWMYDNPQIANHAFSYFKDLQGNVSSAALLIEDFIKAGILDVMHSYGNFATIGDFSRSLALQALETLEKQGLKISVWTNHGGIESMQNIGRTSLGKGDLKNDNDFYHSDLLISYGINYYWDTETSLVTNVGNDCPAKFGDAFWRSPLYQGWQNRLKGSLKGGLTLSDKFVHRITRKSFIPGVTFDNKQNDLISLDIMRDNNKIYKFKRFGLGRYDWSDDIPLLLNKKVIDRLIRNEGYLILYVHLGDRRNSNDRLPLSPHTVKTLKYIAELYHNGILWINTTSKLLKYNLLTKILDLTVKENKNSVQIFINGISAQIKGFDLSEDDFAGLTFYVPDYKKIELIFKNKSISFNKNPPDNIGKYSITIPLHKIEWPL